MGAVGLWHVELAAGAAADFAAASIEERGLVPMWAGLAKLQSVIKLLFGDAGETALSPVGNSHRQALCLV